ADPKGKMVRGEKAPFNWVPNGIPGVETRLPILFSEGVGKGRISLSRFVELAATNPAKMYGLYPRKGTLAIGADADIVIFDPERPVRITNALLHHNVDYTPYEGLEVKGWPQTVLSRGDILVDNGTFVAADGRGRFLHCDKPEFARPKAAA
ncbi:MAG TPA: amidohydrolase family protein, partial [Vineibacter sp.]|nr:amidohydrolase family protein [Vineibacter sp.]